MAVSKITLNPLFKYEVVDVTVTQSANSWGSYDISSSTPSDYTFLFATLYTASDVTGRNEVVVLPSGNGTRIHVYARGALSSSVLSIKKIYVVSNAQIAI